LYILNNLQFKDGTKQLYSSVGYRYRTWCVKVWQVLQHVFRIWNSISSCPYRTYILYCEQKVSKIQPNRYYVTSDLGSNSSLIQTVSSRSALPDYVCLEYFDKVILGTLISFHYKLMVQLRLISIALLKASTTTLSIYVKFYGVSYGYMIFRS